MERRWSKRKSVRHEVLLRHEGLGMMRCETRNISFEGAFITTGQFLLPSNAEIELHFARHKDASADVVRIGAHVVGVYEDGVGVNFSRYDEGSYRYLLSILESE